MTYTFRDFGNIAISAAPKTKSFNLRQIDRETGDMTMLLVVDADTDMATQTARIVYSKSSGCLFLNRGDLKCKLLLV
jgi:hypothetical protein